MTQWGLDVLFNPAKRHMDEEKQRLQSTREEAGDASKGNRIDLTSGKVTIRRKPSAADAANDDADADATVEAAGDPVEPTDVEATDVDATDPVSAAIAEAADATNADALTDATYAAQTDPSDPSAERS